MIWSIENWNDEEPIAIIKIHDNGSRGGHRPPLHQFTVSNYEHCYSEKGGGGGQFHIESAATSTEEISDPFYPPARRRLAGHGIDCTGKTVRQLRNRDYDQFGLLIGMGKANLRNMYRICGGNFDGKLHLLMGCAGQPDSEVADSWCTGDFEATWQDVLEGCTALLEWLTQQ